MQWHYKKDDVWIGPINDEEKDRLVKSGVITRDTPVNVCYDSATFVPLSPSIKNESWIEGANASVRKIDKYYYYGVHSDTRKEREIESVEKELAGDVEEWEYGNREDEGLEVSDEDELENDELSDVDDEDEFFEEYDEDDEDELVDDEDFDDDEETDFEDLEETNELEYSDDEGDKESETINDEEDVLAVASDDYLFNVAEFTNVESSEEDFDELAVLPDWNIDADDSLENEDGFADGGSSVPRELNRSDEQFNRKALFEEQAERLKAIEEKLAKVCRDFNGFKTENNERLGVLEDGSKSVSEKYDELDANVKSISNDILNDAKDWEERFNFQAENSAITRQNITGIKRKFNGEIEEKNRRLVDLEEKSSTYERNFQKIDAQIAPLLNAVSLLETRLDEQKKQILRSFSSLVEFEEVVNDLKRRVNGDVQRHNSLDQQIKSTIQAVSDQGRNITEVCERIAQIDSTLQNIQERNRRLGEGCADLASSMWDIEQKIEDLQRRYELQERQTRENSAALQKDQDARGRLDLLEERIDDSSNEFKQEQSRQFEELKKQDQRITTVVGNFIDCQTEQDKLSEKVSTLEKKIEILEIQALVARRRSEEGSNVDDTSATTETFFERWGGKFIVDRKFRKFSIVASVGLLFLIFEILRLLFR